MRLNARLTSTTLNIRFAWTTKRSISWCIVLLPLLLHVDMIFQERTLYQYDFLINLTIRSCVRVNIVWFVWKPLSTTANISMIQCYTMKCHCENRSNVLMGPLATIAVTCLHDYQHDCTWMSTSVSFSKVSNVDYYRLSVTLTKLC